MSSQKPFMKRLLPAAVAMAMVAAAPGIVLAQSADSTLRGHAPPEATITARNVDTGAVRVTRSSKDGSFALVGLRPGTYQVDAGAGTGLCGPILRPLAKHLHGIDLSAGMLAKAAARGDYDALDEAELTAWLSAHPQAYDLVVSADTLCYFGILDAAITAAAAALRSGGHLIFTVEQTGEDELAAHPAFKLHSHGRYSHAESYVRQALAGAGLDVREISHVVLRNESKKPVTGLLVGARKA